MLCQNCNNEQATLHYKQIVNGEKREAHLCTECASKLGYDAHTFMSGSQFNIGLDSFLSNMFTQNKTVSPHSTVTCPLCGAHEADIARTGRVGCSQCYTVFGELLNQYINRIHGNASHVGRFPEGLDEKRKSRLKLDSLRADMQRAVESQEYEKAAEIRDKIKELEGGMESDS